jgi:hypothetical protein
MKKMAHGMSHGAAKGGTKMLSGGKNKNLVATPTNVKALGGKSGK